MDRSIIDKTISLLTLDLYDREDENILELNTYNSLPIMDTPINLNYWNRIQDISLVALYKATANGFVIEWEAKQITATGKLNFLPIEQIVQTWKDRLYYESDVEFNDLIAYYHPIDMPSETISCGMLITPNFVTQSIYLHHAPEPETFDLDLDLEGYVHMAKEACIFANWQLVLLNIANLQHPIIKQFRKTMPRLFPDFNWDAFVEKYESLKLSNQ